MFKRHLYRTYCRLASLKHRLSRRVTATGWMIVVALFIAAALGLNTDLSVAYQTFAFLFCLAWVALGGLLLNQAKFSVERILPKFGSVGQSFRYQMIVSNTSRQAQRGIQIIDGTEDPRPTYEEFLHTPEPGEEKRNWYDRMNAYYRWQWLVSKNRQAITEEHSLASVAAHGKAEVEMELTPLKRGPLRFTDLTVACPEPLGFFRTLKRVPAPQSVLILPKRYTIPAVALPGRSKYQQGGVAMASSVGESEEFVALRDYRAGDPIKHVHWKSFAKLGKPIVKEFQDEFFVRHALILDTFGIAKHSELFEEAVSVAASFAYTIQTQDSLLDLMFVGPQAYCFTSGRGVGHMEQMLEILAGVQPCYDKPFQTLENMVIEHLNEVSGCICIFVSWDQERQNFVQQLRIMGMPVLVLVATEEGAQLMPGPMAADPEHFRALPIGSVAEKLATISLP